MKSSASSLHPTSVWVPFQLPLAARKPSPLKWGRHLNWTWRTDVPWKSIERLSSIVASRTKLRLTEAQTWDVDTLGLRVFAFHQNAIATVRSLLETALLFTPLHTKGKGGGRKEVKWVNQTPWFVLRELLRVLEKKGHLKSVCYLTPTRSWVVWDVWPNTERQVLVKKKLSVAWISCTASGVAPLAAKRNVDFLTKYVGIEMKMLVF